MTSEVTSYYDGSRIFAGLSESLGLSVDKVNFIISQIVALFLAGLYRTVLHPTKVTAATRHVFGLAFGLIMGFFCFGVQAIHLAALPTVCHMIIRTTSPYVMQRVVLAVALLYLSVIHIHRQTYDYGSYSLDITGPLMVIVQKVTSLALNIHDGITKSSEDMTKTQKLYAVNKIPSTLEYFSFVLQFPTLMTGPALFYREYIDFIEGGTKLQVSNGAVSNGQTIIREPSPARAVYKKVALASLYAIIFIKFLPMYPISRVKEDDFVENTSMSAKFMYLFTSTTLVRFKYYFAWTFADAICNNAGIGYNGEDDKGSPKWDKFSNVDVLGFELATNLYGSIASWNLSTNRWLRMVVYDRVQKYSIPLTFALSAIWHGFYPGYYLTFASGALFTAASKVVRKHVRDYFQANTETKTLYDVITFIVTRLLMAYMVYTFVLLEFWPCVRLYTHMYWCFHLGAVVTIFIVPIVVPKTDAVGSGSKHNLVSPTRSINDISRHN